MKIPDGPFVKLPCIHDREHDAKTDLAQYQLT